MAMDDDSMTEDDDLSFVREKRKMIINYYLNKGIDKIEDVKEVTLVATLLNDMDRTALGKKRLKTDDKRNNNSAAAIDLISKIFTEKNVKDIMPEDAIAKLVAPELEMTLDNVTTVDGEMDTNVSVEDYESFMNRVGVN
jgi:hypothetical protein